MKKATAIFLFAMMFFTMTACGNNNTPAENTPAANPSSSDTLQNESQTGAPEGISSPDTSEPDTFQGDDNVNETGNILVAYFSHTGNTETIANMIADTVNAGMFKVETVTPYPDDYNECVDVAAEEQRNNARPELSSHVEDMSQYDVIFLGYPNWWGTMPMAMFTFLEEYDFSGKTIIPFCTHAGSRLGSSESDLAEICPDSTLLEGIAVSGSQVNSAQADVEAWISNLGVLAE